MTTHTTDFVSDWGGLGNGVFNNSPKWQDWLDYVALLPAGDDAVLRIPGSAQSYILGTYMDLAAGCGGRHITIEGYGGTVTLDTAGNGLTWGMGDPRFFGPPPNGSIRLQTCSAGANSVFSIPGSEADTALFNTYQPWCYVAGVDTQGRGTSANPGFFEYKKISSVNTSTGEITFTSPLKYSYKETWPLYYDNNPVEPDLGGPATIFAIKTGWDMELEYQNITFPVINTSGIALNIYARKVKLTNCTVLNTNGFNPSIIYLLWIDGGDWSAMGNCEHDKLVNTLVFSGGVITSTSQWQLQSCCTERIIVDDATVQNLNGTPMEFVLTTQGTVTSLNLGATAYGYTSWAKIAGTVGSLGTAGPLQKGTGEVGVNNAWGLSAGVITIPKADSEQQSGFVPGCTCFWVDSAEGRNRRAFRVTDMTDDATYTYVTIDPPVASWATLTANFGPLIWVRTHPCPQLYVYPTASGVTADFQLAGSWGQPIYTYTKRNYGTQASGSVEAIGYVGGGSPTYTANYTGTLTSATLTVNPALSSPSANLKWPAIFANYRITKSDYTVDATYQKTISLNSTSTTTISGLSLPDPSSWFTGASQMGADADLFSTSSPMNLQIELTFDQQVVPQSTPITAFECEQLLEVFESIPELYTYYPECQIALEGGGATRSMGNKYGVFKTAPKKIPQV